MSDGSIGSQSAPIVFAHYPVGSRVRVECPQDLHTKPQDFPSEGTIVSRGTPTSIVLSHNTKFGQAREVEAVYQVRDDDGGVHHIGTGWLTAANGRAPNLVPPSEPSTLGL